MAKEALLDRVPIPPDHIHRIRGEDDPERAAAEYEGELRRLLTSPHPERSEGSSRLCLVLLGLGDDGHTASLFPRQSAVRETARWVVAVPGSSRSPDAVPRVTLTPVILNRARNVTFVVSGANKAQTLQRVVEGPFNSDVLPAQAIRPREGRLTWMVDEAAAGALRLHRAST
jgi:6-phosphogluconolactonase